MNGPALRPTSATRLDAVVDVIVAMAGGDLSARGEIGPDGDEVDAVVAGLAMLGEELHVMQGQLVQSAKLASLGEVSAGIAHELNQPLGIIQLYAEAALSHLERAPDGEHERAACDQLAVVIDQVRRASEIINHVGVFARDDARFESSAADVHELVGGALLLIRRELAEQGIELDVSIATDVGPLHCVANRVQQLLFNLVTNARDAVRGRPGAAIGISVRAPCAAGRGIVIEVSDNGPGVPAGDLDRILDPFFTTKPAGRGTGLGLSICQTIALEHGAELSHRRCDERTVFTVQFPEA